MLFNFPLKKITAMKVGGPARYFVQARSAARLLEAASWAKQGKIDWRVIGEGSNLVPADRDYPGLIIKNEVQFLKFNRSEVCVSGGFNLFEFIKELNRRGQGGLEKMAGIPGTIGGAIYGCAGAYGQEIKDRLTKVRFFNGKKIKEFDRHQCRFAYRHSIFKKHQDWIILEAEFRLKKEAAFGLQKTSQKIVAIRKVKYPPALCCPGSFFKNIKMGNLSAEQRRRIFSQIAPGEIKNGKLPAAILLEKVGAKGLRRGRIQVADYHANLIFNLGAGQTKEIKSLAVELKKRVRLRFDLILEEEVQYI